MTESPRPTLFLVEDDDVEAERVMRTASRLAPSLAIRRAIDGVEALDILRNELGPPLEKPYLVLLDLKLPRMGGLRFLEELRGDPRLRTTVVFVLTTSRNDEDRRQAYENLVAGYIPKSNQNSAFDEVIQMLWRYLNVVELP